MSRPPDADPWRLLRVRSSTLDALARIAAREGLTYGGSPSPPRALAWLVDRDKPPTPNPTKEPRR
jgi:hypothetical protein